MLWGIGTGRCGTKSLAVQCGGLHEPEPWLREAPALWHHGQLDDREERDLKFALTVRRDLDTPIIVDLKHALCLPLILEVDPEARFVWVIRDPISCIESLYTGGAFSKQDWYGTRKMTPVMPPDIESWGRWMLCAYHWDGINKTIWSFLDREQPPWTLIKTVELSVHENKYPHHTTMPPFFQRMFSSLGLLYGEIVHAEKAPTETTLEELLSENHS